MKVMRNTVSECMLLVGVVMTLKLKYCLAPRVAVRKLLEDLFVQIFTVVPMAHQGREIIAIVPLENGAFALFLVKISINFRPGYST
jgi:uncharacterized membrane protein